MYLFAANDALECFFQFGMVAFFLLMSFGGWVIKQIAASAQRRAAKRRQEEQQWQSPPSQTTSSHSTASQSSRPQRTQSTSGSRREAGNPYVSYLRGDSEPVEVMEAEVVEAVEEHHLTSTLSSDHLTQHASQLGSIDSQLEGSIHDHFDYEVGQLGDSSDEIHEDPNADKLPAIAVTTGEIADIFRNPERIREALIMNEILTRPNLD